MEQIAESALGEFATERLADIYLKMLQIRNFEEKVAYLFSRGLVHGTTHLYSGEEAVAVGVLSAMEEQDLITSTHRGHGHCIAKGIDLNRMMAELLGKEVGYCRGKGGSMHIADLSCGNLGANGVVGGGIPIAVGAGLTTKMKRIDRVVISFFGDGALNQGVFHESLNLAAIWNLPVIFVCENNQYAMSMSTRRAFKIEDLSIRAAAYGIPGKSVDGNDVLAVHREAKWARGYVRKEGPALLVCRTYRFKGHSKSDANRYRTKEEIEEWKQRDPIPRFRALIEAGALMSKQELDEIEERALADIETAVAFAQAGDPPSPDTILDDVYA